LKEVEKKEIYG